MIKVGMIGRFPPENIPFATYLKNLVTNLKRKCKVITIGLRESDCDYVIKVDENFTKNLNDIIEKEKLDILHIQYIASSEYFAQYSKITIMNYLNTILVNMRLLKTMDKIHIPIVVTLHELNIESKNVKQSVVAWLEKKVIGKSDKVIVHSAKQRDLLSNMKFDATFIRFGLNAINVKKSIGKNILYLATIYPSRGVEFLIRAMKGLPDYKLVIKGATRDNAYAALLQNEIKENRLTNVNLEFGWGSQMERDKLYRWANIVVLPYLWAPNQSAALHDAFSYRTPVVVTNTNGPIDETVKEFNCGEVVEMGSPEELVNGIKKVHRNYQKYLKAVDKYRKVANWNFIANKHVEVYKRLSKTVGDKY